MSDDPRIFMCSFCAWKKVATIEDSGLHELSNDSMSARKFRCPSCGRAITPRKFLNPQAEVEKKASEEAMKSEHEKWLESSMDYQKSFIEGKDGKDDN